jgi:hypothetical protein
VANDEEAQAAEESIGRTAKLTAHEVISTDQDAQAESSEEGQPRPAGADQG